MKCNRRTSITLFLVIVMMAWANHCILNDAYAATKSPGHSAPCHESGDKKEGHHKKCEKTGCCQPALKASPSSLSQINFDNVIIPFALNNFVITFETAAFVTFVVPQHTNGPPGSRILAIDSLSSAPQAPPYSS